MRLTKEFDVARPRAAAAAVLASDATILSLFAEAKTEIVKREGNKLTTHSRFKALGRDSDATFHFTFAPDGNVRFEKVCDGNVWKQLTGKVTFEERAGKTRVRLEMDGSTKGFIPEFAIKGPLQDQLDSMARALREKIEKSGDVP
jgi:carbon monoxide dehydrogenase subunit G